MMLSVISMTGWLSTVGIEWYRAGIGQGFGEG